MASLQNVVVVPRTLVRKVDDNQKEIVAALRRLGYSVLSIATIGKGCPDIMFGKHGINNLAEIKDGSKPPSARKLTPDETAFHADWRGTIAILQSVDDVIAFDKKYGRN